MTSVVLTEKTFISLNDSRTTLNEKWPTPPRIYIKLIPKEINIITMSCNGLKGKDRGRERGRESEKERERERERGRKR